MPADTVVIGDKAFELDVLENADYTSQINDAIMNIGDGGIFYSISGGITDGFVDANDGTTKMTAEQQAALKDVVLLKADGTTETYKNFEDETPVAQADLTAYNAALAKVAEADYTAESWTAYKAVVDANMVTGSNTQAEVDAATAAITAAQANLVSIHQLEVEGVTATNNKEIVVKFNKAVDKTTAEDLTNYTLTATTAVLTGGSAKLADDKMTVTLTLATAAAQQEAVTVKVEKIKAEGEATAMTAVTKSLTFFDVSAPVAEKIEVTGPKSLKVTFSEPLKVSPTFILNGGAYSVTPSFTAGDKTATLALGATLPAGDHTVQISGGQDYSAATGLAINKTDLAFTYAADAVAPTVSVEKATETVVTLKFTKPVKATNINTDVTAYHSVNNSTNYKATLTAVTPTNGYSDTYTATFTTPIPNGAGKMIYLNTKADKLQDEWGNDVASTSLTFDMVSDVTGPVVSAVEATGTGATAQKELTVSFDETLNSADAISKLNYVLKDAAGAVVQTATFADVDNTGKFNANATLTYDSTKKQVKVALTNVLKAGAYKLEVSNIKDSSYSANKMTTQTVDFTVADKVVPTVGAISLDSANKTIYVNFSEAMNNADIANIANYGLEVNGSNSNIPTGTTVTVLSPQKVKLVIPASATTPTTGNTVKVQVVGTVKDVAGNAIGGLLGTSTNNVTWGTASTFTLTQAPDDVKLVAKNQLQLEVANELSAIDSSKFTVGNTDGALVASATYVNNAGKSTITVTLDKDITKTDLSTLTNLVLADGAIKNAEGLSLSGGPTTFTKAAHFADKLAPVITSVETTATNKVTVTLSENLKVGDASNYSFAVAGNTITAVDNTTPNIVVLTLGTAIDTDATPAVTQLLDLRDAADNKLMAGTAVVATTDKVAPVLTGAAITTSGTNPGFGNDAAQDEVITLTFSEPVKITDTDTAAVTILEKFTLAGGTDGSNFTGAVVSNNTTTPSETITITVNGTVTNAVLANHTIDGIAGDFSANEIEDVAGNDYADTNTGNPLTISE
jgi:hypothetical protein